MNTWGQTILFFKIFRNLQVFAHRNDESLPAAKLEQLYWEYYRLHAYIDTKAIYCQLSLTLPTILVRYIEHERTLRKGFFCIKNIFSILEL